MEMIEKERRIAMETQDKEKIGWVREKLERLDAAPGVLELKVESQSRGRKSKADSVGGAPAADVPQAASHGAGQLGPEIPICPKVKLRLLLILPGLCHRDMLSFNGNCYAVSKVRANVTAAMSSIRGDAQLASFSSMSEIRSLVAAKFRPDRQVRAPQFDSLCATKTPLRLSLANVTQQCWC
uniref:Uncharacterized protein n=1 Tax=Macrostomum lignano TaxID=282301 RepID=A0A1I8GKI3_9PLAT